MAPLTDEWRVEADDRNYILQRKTISTAKKAREGVAVGDKTERWVDEGYFRTMEHVVEHLRNVAGRKVTAQEWASIDQLVEALRSVLVMPQVGSSVIAKALS